MNQNYRDVPDIITGKDLDYLSDMFEWNYSAYKKYNAYEKAITIPELKEIFNDASQMFYSNMQQVLNILKGGQSNE